MPQPLHTGRLLLALEEPRSPPANTLLLEEKLKAIGFIQERIRDQPMQYRLGSSFMQLVTFMGCSASIRLEPNDKDEAFCHATFLGPYQRPRLLIGRNTTPPRCPGCNSRLADWRESLARRSQAPCPHCGRPLDPLDLNWRHSAGSGRLFLCVENIFPGEAIPTPELMKHLQEASEGRAWRYFYIQEP